LFSRKLVKIMVYLMLFAMISSVVLYAIGMLYG